MPQLHAGHLLTAKRSVIDGHEVDAPAERW
jgi:hypothetical protein